VSHPWITSVLHSFVLVVPALIAAAVAGGDPGDVLPVVGAVFGAGCLSFGVRRARYRRAWLAEHEAAASAP
jgi:hypothetical protein